ncbi:TrgA family protein [Pseudoprimorskyibacter insulae]|uniref:Tellurium resistance protein n=1 Tax=Pseudoprimorskyibacter insulae TaxID=1695997 RepID=A0A2R8AW85_9RHOB|nr:TrgA family protein [Pseudoprimorskyibacter insulae]SPF80296.1 hypothetical protein PRI8871_02099 [Pseudoprimorskyibacter insulae]
MFTAARLVAGILFAGFAFLISEQFKTLMPPDTAYGSFNLVNAAVGFFCGWWIVGKRAGRGWGAGIGNGITGTVALLFWALFVQGIYHMWQESMRHRYGDVLEAFAGVVEFGLKHGALMLNLDFIKFLLIGAVIVGLVIELTARNWR